MTRCRRAARAALILSVAAAPLSGGPVRAADLAGAYAPAEEVFAGIDCANGAPPQWPSVWLGHVQGGIADYDANVGQTALGWLDVKMCFPTQRSCGAWVRSLRRDYHRPIGYFTCLPLR